MMTNSSMEALAAITVEAGAEIMRHYAGARSARAKADRSPVTEADLAAHHLISARLAELAPEIPVISEEDEAVADLRASSRYFLVDPLDGTRSYVRGEGEFTVNIGLIEENYPVMGAIYVPQTGKLYYGGANLGCFRRHGAGAPEPIAARVPPSDGLDVVKSSHHPSARLEEYLRNLRVRAEVAASSSVKFCTVAEGQADLYPRFGTTMEWDTAAGQAIVEAAGGRVTFEDGTRFSYGKPGFTNPAFIVRGK